ncbi:MAG: hypothetical protein OEU40_10025, partial [Gammaproteobacteria bacterium]|nr:hypothetical protein [Gammaproteobacteria bacterium]
MQISDDTLREIVSRAWQRGADDDHPSFDSVWQAARDRCSTERRRYRGFASVAAIAAAIVIGL